MKTNIGWLLFFPVAVVAAELKPVTIYGQIGSGLEVSQIKGGGGHLSRTQVSDLNSYIGMRGKYPIGESANVIWQFEQDVPVGESGSLRDYFRRKKETGYGR